MFQNHHSFPRGLTALPEDIQTDETVEEVIDAVTPLEVKIVKEKETPLNDDPDYEDFDITTEQIEEIEEDALS